MNSVRNHRATGFTTDRKVAKQPWHVVTLTGRLLGGCDTEERAASLAAVINQGRDEPVRVVARGTKS